MQKAGFSSSNHQNQYLPAFDLERSIDQQAQNMLYSEILKLTNTQCTLLQCVDLKPDLPRSYQAPFSCHIPSTPAALMRPGECRTSPLHMFGQYPQLQDAV